jgi:hypothetical protein
MLSALSSHLKTLKRKKSEQPQDDFDKGISSNISWSDCDFSFGAVAGSSCHEFWFERAAASATKYSASSIAAVQRQRHC